jgi:RNA polymerase sigma-70 factor (ECF subfamily)
MAAPEVDLRAERSDEQLVAAICSGEEAAFRTLYDRYFPRVYNFVQRRLRNRADTEETVQEVFFNLFASIDSFRGESAFAAWVFGLTRRTIAGRFKKKQHAMVPLGDEDPESVDLLSPTVRREPNPLEAYECNERLARMDAVVEQELSDEQWSLFRLHHLQNHSIQDIARSMRKSEDAVKSHLYRARKLLLAR